VSSDRRNALGSLGGCAGGFVENVFENVSCLSPRVSAEISAETRAANERSARLDLRPEKKKEAPCDAARLEASIVALSCAHRYAPRTTWLVLT
jgi:hypothetical protein